MVIDVIRYGLISKEAIDFEITWELLKFNNIKPWTLDKIFKLRQDVFIVEQDVPYSDIDGKDPYCIHLTGFWEDELLAYMRIVPLNLFEQGCWSMGRVVTRIDVRGKGLGRIAVEKGLDHLENIRGSQPIKISSQLYLEKFYMSFGFKSVGKPYIEDRIPHIAMVKS